MGKNKETGKMETLATHTLIKLNKRNDGTYSTEKAKVEDDKSTNK